MGAKNPSISFHCKACGEEAAGPRRYDGEVAGFHSVKWLSLHPGPDPQNPLLLEKAPAKGDHHWLSVRFPFFATAAEPFWCLYQPPMSYYNGWEDQPQEIPDSAVVECRLLEVKDQESQSARILVKVLRSVLVSEIANEFGLADSAGNLFDTFENSRSWLSRFDRFRHLSYALEGDVGVWAVVERRRDDDYLLLHGDWSWHTDRFSVENRRLSPAETAIVARLAAGENRLG